MITEIQCSSLTINPLDIISKSYLEYIKLKDKHPRFATYVVGTEGISKPKVLETGMSKIIKWSKDAIRKVSSKIQVGLNCIIGHTKDNNLRNEIIAGQVSGVDTRVINGKLSSIIAVYFPDKNIPSNLDVISMESDVVFDNDGEIQDVLEIKRFALGNSAEVTPAFEGAIRLTEVQCFEPVTQIKQEGNSKMTFNDVKQAVRDLNIFPSQLWTLEELIGHFEVKDDKGLFYGGVDNKLIDSINRRIPDIKKFKDEISTKEAKLKELEENVKSFQEEKAILTKKQSEIKLREFITNNATFDQKQKTWLEKKLAKFKPENGSEDEIKSFVDEQLVDYKEFIALHNDKFMVENAKLLPEESMNTNGIPKGFI